MNFAVFIYGPTAVGKTDFANKLARQLPCEIINLDVGQLYTPLTIGTAKPTLHDVSVPHHMFNVCSQPTNFSVTEYRTMALSLINQIIKRGNIPLFVGGSGFYMNSLLFPPLSYSRISHHAVIDESTPLWDQLNNIDSARATAIHPHDTYRLKRALVLYQQTGVPPSSLKPAHCPIIAPYILCLTQPIDILKQRIAHRVNCMFEDGWIREVKTLIGTPWEDFLLRKKIIGYPEIIAYCRTYASKPSLENIKETISRTTWHYARKQLCYTRMFRKKIHTYDHTIPYIHVDLTSQPLELYIDQLTRTILSSQKGFCNE